MSDNGTQLTSKVFKNFFNELGINHITTTVRQPKQTE